MKSTVPLKGGYMGFHVSLGECNTSQFQFSCPIHAPLFPIHCTVMQSGVLCTPTLNPQLQMVVSQNIGTLI